MKGDKVIVRAYNNEAVACLVWDILGEIVLVVSEKNWSRLSCGEDGIVPVGFRQHDVYLFDEKLVQTNKRDWWKSAKPFPI